MDAPNPVIREFGQDLGLQSLQVTNI